MASSPIRVLVIAGPTAVGKSSLALELCRQLGGEIISADSVQVYKRLDIGSNKASVAERADVPHHLLDCADPFDPSDQFTAGRFVREAEAAIEDCAVRGKVPIVCGGTPLYLQWLVHGPPDAPASVPGAAQAIARRLKPLEESGDWAGGLALLAKLSPARAAELNANDWYRLARAIEVAEATHAAEATPAQEPATVPATEAAVPAASVSAAAAAAAASPPPSSPKPCGALGLRGRFDFRCVFLAPRDKWALFERIDERCEELLQLGLLNEVAGLVASGGASFTESLPAKAIGYRQTLDYLFRTSTSSPPPPPSPPAADDAFDAFLDAYCTATRNYASQQIKWFRKDPAFAFLSVPLVAARPPPPKADRAQNPPGSSLANKKRRKAEAAEAEAQAAAAAALAREGAERAATAERAGLPQHVASSVFAPPRPAYEAGVLRGPESAGCRQGTLDPKLGKRMKLYGAAAASRRWRLAPGTEARRAVMAEADEATAVVFKEGSVSALPAAWSPDGLAKRLK